MTAQCELGVKRAAGVPMSVFERYLTVWVFLCIVIGIALGHFTQPPMGARAHGVGTGVAG